MVFTNFVTHNEVVVTNFIATKGAAHRSNDLISYEIKDFRVILRYPPQLFLVSSRNAGKERCVTTLSDYLIQFKRTYERC